MSSSEDVDSGVSSSQQLQAAQQRPTDLELYQDEAEILQDEAYDESDHSQPSVTGVQAGPHEEGSPGQQSSNDPLQVEAERSSNPSRTEGSGSGSPYPPQRPNKYYGAPSTWRAWTAPERELAASLDQIRAKDLSIHLYNAFNLKKGYNKSRRPWNEPGKETISERQKHYRPEWKPPDVWTAWPMTSGEVPREGCLEWEGDETWRFESLAQSSVSVLEDVLASQILRKARHTFRARQWDDKYTDSEGPVPSRIIHESQSHSHADQDPLQVPDSIPDEHQLEPAIMTDDAEAQQILRPTIRHLLTKLDDLLRGMHHARAAYGYAGNDPAGIRVRRNTSSCPASRRQQQQSTKLARSHGHWSRPSSNSDQEYTAGCDASPSSTDTEDQRPRATGQVGRKPSARRTKLGLRDWSDILAIASMTGWDLAVIERTARRCSELFGESVMFRTLEEGQDHSRDATYLLGTSAREAASNAAVSSEPSTIQAESLKGKTLCPRKECHRSHRGFSTKGDLDNHMRVQHSTVELSNHPRINNEEMFGGVHIDGFLQPIQGKQTNQAAQHMQRKRKQRHVGTRGHLSRRPRPFSE